jgi:hypothetical protein
MVPIRSGVVWKAYPEVPIHPSSAQHARLLKEAPQPHSATPPQSHHREPSTVLSQQDFSTETSRHRGSVGVCLPQCPLHHGLPWPLFSQDATTGIVGLGQSHMGDRSVHIFVTLLMASSACARWDWERCPLYGHWTDIADALMAIVGCCHLGSALPHGLQLLLHLPALCRALTRCQHLLSTAHHPWRSLGQV